ncbi:inter-alpha-trypsin inhibitor heavy chain H3-like isoform X1 [Lepidochelys kempii]|uniref:inter-alpha-trypsin inhibitor heavy chain H3-like isoform X1 n=1 Tax=Lepidochelys kempii TaxID=8472 RepID=UPI003C701696
MDIILFYVLLTSIATTTNAEFVITQFRNIIKKRSTNDVIFSGIDIYSMKIDSKVTSRFAHNVITSRAVNRASVSKEVLFEVELPKMAFITNFSMTIDGITYLGNIKEKEAAKKQYEKAVSRGHTAGLVKASGRKTEKFTVSVNIAAASKVTFELTYEELLKRHLGKYEMLIKVKPKQLVKQFQIEANIFEPQGISELEALGSFINNDLTQTIEKSFSGKKGHVSFKPTIDQQRTCENCSTSFLDGDFTIKYDVKRDSPGNLQIISGYFVHFFAPANLPRVPKNVIFVIDISHSMLGQKMEQTKEALLKILDDVKENDHFNFILFNNRIIPWKEYLVKATLENLKEAQKFVQSIKATGSTNINDALIRTVEMMNEAHKEKVLPERSSSTVIMLTDGNPTSGELNQGKIQENVKNAIQGRYSLYNLAFGYDMDYNFLEKMALENNGLTRRIYEDSDSALQLQSFYDEVANPMLRAVQLHYPINATSELTQNNFNHYYDGSEIVVAGRIIDNDLNSFTADVKAQGANNDVTFTEQVNIEETAKALHDQEYIFGNYIERLWAYLTIQQLLEKRISAQEEKRKNLAAQALELSLKYKFVTPLTSMVVTKPEDKATIADKPVEVDGDPHFLIDVPQKKDHLCFNINLDPGVVLNLVNDPDTGITVNGQLIGKKKVSNNGQTQKTYIGKLGIVNTQLDLKIEITTEKITLQNGRNTATFTWLDTITLQKEGLTMEINREKNLVLSFRDGATFIVVLHRVWKKHPLHQDFLGFYTLDSHKVSEHTHGLLGQFFQHIDFEVFDIRPGSDPEKPHATMIVKNNKLTVTRVSEKDYGKDPSHGTIIPCWFIHNNGTGLIDGAHTNYIVSNLFSTPFIN